MKDLTRSARSHLERYLHAVRTSLVGAPSVDPREVERDVLDHIERELGECHEPVDVVRLQLVLDRLGSPVQWTRVEDLPLSRRVAVRMRLGPQAWRLAYLSLGLFFVAVAAAMQVRWEIVVAVLGAAFLCARGAAANAAGSANVDQGWLIGPALLAVYVGLAGLLVLGPIVPIDVACHEVLRLEAAKPGRFPDRMVDVATRIAAIPHAAPDGGEMAIRAVRAGPWVPAILGGWWCLLGILTFARAAVIRFLFEPFVERHGRWIGISLLALGATSLVVALLLGMAKTAAKHGVF